MTNAGIVGGGHSGSGSKAVFKMINVLFRGFLPMNGHETDLLRDGAGDGFPGSKVGAGTPAGVPEAAGLDSGGIASLNHRLQAGIPPG